MEYSVVVFFMSTMKDSDMMRIQRLTVLMIFLLCNFIAYAQPGNDEPCDAIQLEVNSTCNFANFSNNGGTMSTAVPSPGCGGYMGGDVWFEFTLPISGRYAVVELGADGITDGGLAIYSGSDCNNLTLVDCAQNTSTGDMPSIMIQDGCSYANVGETYWVRVWENGNDNNGTFNICAYEAAAPPPLTVSGCNGFEPPANNCCDAIIYNLCDLDGFCNTTNANYTSENAPPFCAIIDNNAWLAFIANQETVDFMFTVTNCNFNFGIHTDIYSTGNCNTFVNVTDDCFNPGPAQDLSGTLSAINLTPGEIYYIMIDGWAGDVCDYTINVLSDPRTATIEAVEQTICQGESSELSVDVSGYQYGDFSYSWSPTATLQNADTATPTATPSSTTIYTVTVTGNCGVYEYDVPVTVIPTDPLDPVIAGPLNICDGDANATYMVTDANAVDYLWEITGDGSIVGAADGSSVVVDWGTSTGTICISTSNNCTTSTQECVTVTSHAIPDISITAPQAVCSGVSFDLANLTIADAANSSGTLSYYATELDAEMGTSPLASSSVTSANTYWVRMETNSACYDVASVVVTYVDPAITVTSPTMTCGDMSVDLATATVTETNGYPGGTISYHTTQADADAGTNEMSSTSVSSGTAYFVRYELPSGCFATGTINVSFGQVPDIVVNQPAVVCSATTFDLNTVAYADINSTTITSTSFYDDATNAENETSPLASSSVSSSDTYYIRVETADGCFDTAEITVDFGVTPTASITGGGQVCSGDDSVISFFLNGTAPFDVVYFDGTNNITLNGISSGHQETVTVASNTDFVLVSVSDAGSCAGTVDVTPVAVTLYTPPTATITGGASGCMGASIDLTFNLTGDGPFDVVYTDGSSNFTMDDIVDGHVESITMASNMCYSLVSVENAAGCTGTISGTACMTPHASPIVNNLTETCNAGYTAYTISFEISDGDVASYEVIGQAGTITGNIFTSDEIANFGSYNLIVTDANDCDPVAISGSHDCSCTTSAGTMDMTTLEACADGSVTAIHNNDESLETGDILEYVLHDGNGPTLGATVFATQSSNVFTMQGGIQAGTTYYISAIAGPNDGSGSVDQSNTCFTVSVGQPVLFHALPAGSISGDATICSGDVAALTLNFTDGTGPFDVVISDGTNTELVENINDGYLHSVNPEENTSYTIVSITDNTDATCVGTGTGTASISILDFPTTSIPQLDCNATSTEYQVTFTISGGDAASYVVTGDGTFDASNNTFTSEWITSGTNFYFEVTDVNNCDPFVVYGNYVCNCVTDAGTLDLSELILCETDIAAPTYNNDSTLDADDVVAFVLHNGTATSIGDVLMSGTSSTFSFDDAILDYGTTYYITAVAGNDDGTGFPVMDTILEPCFSLSEGTPISFYPNPEGSISGGATICEGSDTDLTFAFTGMGPFNVEYSDGTNTIQLNAINSGHVETVSPSANTTYSLVSVEMANSPNCSGTIDPVLFSVEVVVNTIPYSVNFETICDPVTTNFIVRFDIEGGDPSSYDVAGTEGTLIGNQFTSIELAGGSAYQFHISDANNCNTESVIGSEFCGCSPDIRPLITQTELIECQDDENAALSVQNVNGEAPFSFRWSNGYVGNTIDNLGAGMYYVTMTDGNLCESMDSIEIEAPMPLEAEFRGLPPNCYGGDDGMLFFTNVRGGSGGPYLYGIDSTYILADSFFYNMPGGQYLGYVMDPNGCTWVDTINLLDPDELMADIGRDTLIELGNEVEFDLLFTGVIDSFYWSTDTEPYVPCLDCETFKVAPTETTTYNLTAVDENGCVTRARRVIYVEKERHVFIPSAFSPNNDGRNDYFTVYAGADVVSVSELKIYNRWGGLVFDRSDFEPNNPELGWDGIYQSKYLQPNVFVYYAMVVFKDGSTGLYQGDVALIR